jgi:Tfp pilus assembly protein PilX
MKKSESGQALVLVLLSLAVVLTLVLFVLSRSITDIAVSSSQEESVRAFSAAEAGIERALVIGSGVSDNTSNFKYTADVTGYSSGTSDFTYPAPLLSGDTMTTWFVGHDKTTGDIACTNDGNPDTKCYTGNSMKICWGNAGTPVDQAVTPAIELSVYYEATSGDISSIQIGRAAFDPNSTRTATNSFGAPDAGTCIIGGSTYAFQKTVTFSSDLKVSNTAGLLFARVRMFYNTDAGQPVATSVAPGVLPSQGEKIVSTGNAGGTNGVGGSTRRIDVFQGWAESPFGGNAILSPSGITK